MRNQAGKFDSMTDSGNAGAQSYPELAEAAFDEIYAHSLLEDDGGWLVLTEEGFDYILEHGKSGRKGGHRGSI